MSWFMILADDAPGQAAVRKAQRPAHLAYLQQLVDANRLLLAGPRPAEADKPLSDTTIIGSLIVADFDSLTAAQTWATNDPYAVAGLFSQVRIEPFVKALPA